MHKRLSAALSLLYFVVILDFTVMENSREIDLRRVAQNFRAHSVAWANAKVEFDEVEQAEYSDLISTKFDKADLSYTLASIAEFVRGKLKGSEEMLIFDEFIIDYDIRFSMDKPAEYRSECGVISGRITWDKKYVRVNLETGISRQVHINSDLRTIVQEGKVRDHTKFAGLVGLSMNEVRDSKVNKVGKLLNVYRGGMFGQNKLTRLVKGCLMYLDRLEAGPLKVEDFDVKWTNYSIDDLVKTLNVPGAAYMSAVNEESSSACVIQYAMCGEYPHPHIGGVDHIKIPADGKNISLVGYEGDDKKKNVTIHAQTIWGILVQYCDQYRLGSDLETALAIACSLRENRYMEDVYLPKVVSGCDLIFPALLNTGDGVVEKSLLNLKAAKLLGRVHQMLSLVLFKDIDTSMANTSMSRFSIEREMRALFSRDDLPLAEYFGHRGAGDLLRLTKELQWLPRLRDRHIVTLRQYSVFEGFWLVGNMRKVLRNGIIKCMKQGKREELGMVEPGLHVDSWPSVSKEIALYTRKKMAPPPSGGFNIRLSCVRGRDDFEEEEIEFDGTSLIPDVGKFYYEDREMAVKFISRGVARLSDQQNLFFDGAMYGEEMGTDEEEEDEDYTEIELVKPHRFNSVLMTSGTWSPGPVPAPPVIYLRERDKDKKTGGEEEEADGGDIGDAISIHEDEEDEINDVRVQVEKAYHKKMQEIHALAAQAKAEMMAEIEKLQKEKEAEIEARKKKENEESARRRKEKEEAYMQSVAESERARAEQAKEQARKRKEEEDMAALARQKEKEEEDKQKAELESVDSEPENQFGWKKGDDDPDAPEGSTSGPPTQGPSSSNAGAGQSSESKDDPEAESSRERKEQEGPAETEGSEATMQHREGKEVMSSLDEQVIIRDTPELGGDDIVPEGGEILHEDVGSYEEIVAHLPPLKLLPQPEDGGASDLDSPKAKYVTQAAKYKPPNVSPVVPPGGSKNREGAVVDLTKKKLLEMENMDVNDFCRGKYKFNKTADLWRSVLFCLPALYFGKFKVGYFRTDPNGAMHLCNFVDWFEGCEELKPDIFPHAYRELVSKLVGIMSQKEQARQFIVTDSMMACYDKKYWADIGRRGTKYIVSSGEFERLQGIHHLFHMTSSWRNWTNKFFRKREDRKTIVTAGDYEWLAEYLDDGGMPEKWHRIWTTGGKEPIIRTMYWGRMSEKIDDIVKEWSSKKRNYSPRDKNIHETYAKIYPKEDFDEERWAIPRERAIEWCIAMCNMHVSKRALILVQVLLTKQKIALDYIYALAMCTVNADNIDTRSELNVLLGDLAREIRDDV